MQINIATGDGVIHAVQDRNYEKVTASTRRKILERRIKLCKKHLEVNKVDEQTQRGFEEIIAESEAELSVLNDTYGCYVLDLEES